MKLSEEEIRLVQQSFREALDLREPFHTDFYEAFFRRAPETRGMFRDDITGQGMRFMNTLGAIVDNISGGDLQERYADLGQAHAALGVHAAHFEPMREALVETIAATLGDRYSPEIGDAWRKAFDAMAQEMMRLGGID